MSGRLGLASRGLADPATVARLETVMRDLAGEVKR